MRIKVFLFVVSLLALAVVASAHCDWINGPVVNAARAALEKGDVTPVLRWVPAENEAAIRDAFKRTLAARAAGGAARDVADQWFFETLVRVHRASEGEPYTGLQGADYRPSAGLALADEAVDSGSLDRVDRTLAQNVRDGVRTRFAALMEAKKNADKSVEAGRAYVHAYAEFVHYVDNVQRMSTETGEHHAEHGD